MAKRTTLNMEQLEKLKNKMKAAPEKEKAKQLISKQDAVKLLQPEIEAMQRKRYSLEEIAQFMATNYPDLNISVATLKSYLQRVKKEEGEAAAKGKPEK
jgi:FtsZ-binding cell division protein ZapB